jgi:segregation and condensation protein B
LLEEAGRLDLPGRPIAYRTTENFLRCFGLRKLGELPPLPTDNEQLEFDSELAAHRDRLEAEIDEESELQVKAVIEAEFEEKTDE